MVIILTLKIIFDNYFNKVFDKIKLKWIQYYFLVRKLFVKSLLKINLTLH
jgi:hypothetical protein